MAKIRGIREACAVRRHPECYPQADAAVFTGQNGGMPAASAQSASLFFGLPKWLKWLLGTLAAGLLLAVAALLAVQHWVGSGDFKQRAEREATQALGVALTLGRIGLDWWPLPALAVSEITLKTRPPITVGRLEVRPNVSGLLQGRLAVSTVIVRQAVVAQKGVDAVLEALQKKKLLAQSNRDLEPDKASSFAILLSHVVLDDVSWQGLQGESLTVNAEAWLGADALPDKAQLTLVQSRFKGLGDLRGTEVNLKRDGPLFAVAVELKGGVEKPVKRGNLKGQIELQLPASGGVAGKPPANHAVMKGQLKTTGLDLSLVGGDTGKQPLLSGQLDAQTSLSASAASAGKLLDALQTQSTFTARNASVHGIDLAKAVRTVGLSRGGETRLDVLAGQINTQGKAVQLNNLVASSGVLSANGNVAVAPNRSLSGRVNVDLGSNLLPTAAKGAVGVPLQVGGTLDAPEVTLTRAAMIGAAIGTVILPGAGTGAGASLGDKVGEKLKGLFGR